MLFYIPISIKPYSIRIELVLIISFYPYVLGLVLSIKKHIWGYTSLRCQLFERVFFIFFSISIFNHFIELIQKHGLLILSYMAFGCFHISVIVYFESSTIRFSSRKFCKNFSANVTWFSIQFHFHTHLHYILLNEIYFKFLNRYDYSMFFHEYIIDPWKSRIKTVFRFGMKEFVGLQSIVLSLPMVLF